MLHVRFLDIIFIKFLRKLRDFMKTIYIKRGKANKDFHFVSLIDVFIMKVERSLKNYVS